MIQVVVENKYSFSMRVSVKAMAALDRDRSRREVPLVRRLLTSAFNQLGIGLSARLCERLLTEIAHQVDKRPSTNLLCVRLSLAYAKQWRPPHQRCAADWSAHRPARRVREIRRRLSGQYGGRMSSLYQALGSLREATTNKGGHRTRAMDLVRQAIDETQAGVEFADEHAGGGR
jgi:hypothetical protein